MILKISSVRLAEAGTTIHVKVTAKTYLLECLSNVVSVAWHSFSIRMPALWIFLPQGSSRTSKLSWLYCIITLGMRKTHSLLTSITMTALTETLSYTAMSGLPVLQSVSLLYRNETSKEKLFKIGTSRLITKFAMASTVSFSLTMLCIHITEVDKYICLI